uniref:PDZ domain-containing protein n=1 Tax=Seriola lalandi dorsalis TaxID=1841481 RepID=A0A3B4XBJ0_SERLL
VREMQLSEKYNIQEVTLTKNANGLGFSFLMCELDPPTRDFGSLVRIKQLFPGQPAQQSGRIQEGDVLLAVNGQSVKEPESCLIYVNCLDRRVWIALFTVGLSIQNMQM